MWSAFLWPGFIMHDTNSNTYLISRISTEFISDRNEVVGGFGV